LGASVAERDDALDLLTEDEDKLFYNGWPLKPALTAIPILVEIVANPATPNPDRALWLLENLIVQTNLNWFRPNPVDYGLPETLGQSKGRPDQVGLDIHDMLFSHATVFATRLESSDSVVREATVSLMLAIGAGTDRTIGAKVEHARQALDVDAERALLLPLAAWNGPELYLQLLAKEFEANHGPLSRLRTAVELAEHQSPLQERALDYLTSVYQAGDEELAQAFSSLQRGLDFWVRVALPILRTGGDRMLVCLPALTRRVQRDGIGASRTRFAKPPCSHSQPRRSSENSTNWVRARACGRPSICQQTVLGSTSGLASRLKSTPDSSSRDSSATAMVKFWGYYL